LSVVYSSISMRQGKTQNQLNLLRGLPFKHTHTHTCVWMHTHACTHTHTHTEIQLGQHVCRLNSIHYWNNNVHWLFPQVFHSALITFCHGQENKFHGFPDEEVCNDCLKVPKARVTVEDNRFFLIHLFSVLSSFLLLHKPGTTSTCPTPPSTHQSQDKFQSVKFWNSWFCFASLSFFFFFLF
jgi:hypothetical protein